MHPKAAQSAPAGPSGVDAVTTPFDFTPRTRIVYGPGRIEDLGRLAREYGASRVLVVSDPGIVAAGHAGRGLEVLRASGLEAELFDGVMENPTTGTVDAGLEVARRFQPDFLVGLGGGSSMDCAKGVNLLLTNGGRMQDYHGTGRVTRPCLPMIAVPTTAGTGSETQSFALISDAETHVKKACGDPGIACRVALLDPELTLTQPPEVAAITGIDAVSHAVESYVSTRSTEISRMFSRAAWRLLARNFEGVFSRPDDLEVRGGMLLGAAFSGLGIENSMLGATHATANPMTARFGVAHGRAIGIMLPHVVRLNGAAVDGLYAELLADVPDAAFAPGVAAEALAEMLTGMLRTAGLPRTLAEVGIGREMLPEMARDATDQWTGRFNPVALDQSGYMGLYECALQA
jgi:alcohol dehydrogenase